MIKTFIITWQWFWKLWIPNLCYLNRSFGSNGKKLKFQLFQLLKSWMKFRFSTFGSLTCFGSFLSERVWRHACWSWGLSSLDLEFKMDGFTGVSLKIQSAALGLWYLTGRREDRLWPTHSPSPRFITEREVNQQGQLPLPSRCHKSHFINWFHHG